MQGQKYAHSIDQVKDNIGNRLQDDQLQEIEHEKIGRTLVALMFHSGDAVSEGYTFNSRGGMLTIHRI